MCELIDLGLAHWRCSGELKARVGLVIVGVLVGWKAAHSLQAWWWAGGQRV